MRSIRGRYEVIYNWLSLMAIIPRGDVAKAATMFTDGLGLESCSQGVLRAWVAAHLNIWWVWPVTGLLTSLRYECNGELRWRWQTAVNETHYRCHQVMMRLILWLATSWWLVCLFPTMTYTSYELRVQGWTLRCGRFWKWGYGGWCHFGCYFFLFSSEYFFTSLNLCPVQMATAQVFTTCRDNSFRGAVSPYTGSASWQLYRADWW
jgi:hypothetical protein